MTNSSRLRMPISKKSGNESVIPSILSSRYLLLKKYKEKKRLLGLKYFPCSASDEGAEEMTYRDLEPEEIGIAPITPVL